MPNPEQVPQILNDTLLPQRMLQDNFSEKLLREALGTIPNASDNVEKDQASKMKSENKASIDLENVGNIESLKLPAGYSKGREDKRENYKQFDSDANKETKVCYWRRSDFSADDEDTKLMNEVLRKPPHALDEQEILDLMPMMMPGRPWGNGNHKDMSLRTEDLNGRRVLVADFKFNDQDKQVHLIIANQDKDSHQIENVWLEGPSKGFDNNNKAVINAFQQIKWKDK